MIVHLSSSSAAESPLQTMDYVLESKRLSGYYFTPKTIKTEDETVRLIKALMKWDMILSPDCVMGCLDVDCSNKMCTGYGLAQASASGCWAWR